MNVFLSIIIPILTPRESLDCVLKSINTAVNKASIRVQVLVVGSHHESTPLMDGMLSHGLSITHLTVKQETQAYVLNHAFEHALGEWVMVLCPDSLLDEHIFAAHLEQLLLNKYDPVFDT